MKCSFSAINYININPYTLTLYVRKRKRFLQGSQPQRLLHATALAKLLKSTQEELHIFHNKVTYHYSKHQHFPKRLHTVESFCCRLLRLPLFLINTAIFQRSTPSILVKSPESPSVAGCENSSPPDTSKAQVWPRSPQALCV